MRSLCRQDARVLRLVSGWRSFVPVGPVYTQPMKDPVCGMEVDERTAKDRYEYEGTLYVFCRTECLEQFKAAPSLYLGGRSHGAGRLLPAAARNDLYLPDGPGSPSGIPWPLSEVRHGARTVGIRCRRPGRDVEPGVGQHDPAVQGSAWC